MKVMHVIHGLNTGGAETLVKEYALKLDKKKFDVIILCFNHINNSPYELLLKQNNIKTIYVSDYQKFYNKKGLFFKIINYFQMRYYIKKIIHKEDPDIIHSHLPINSYIKIAKPKKNTKMFHTVHSDPNKLWNFKNKSAIKDFKAALWLVKKYKMKFICLHENMKNEVNKMFNVNNSLVLNNGIDFNKFNVKIDGKKYRKKIGIPNDAFVIGHVGRFNKVKNHVFLVDVFNEIYKMNKNAFLLLIGDGVEENNIKNRLDTYGLKNRYLILNNRTDIPDLLGTMNIFVFPSIFEGLGIALIEAQKMELPCFASTNVPDSAIISNLVTKLSIDDLPKIWADMILNYSKPDKIKLNDKDWDIDEIVKQLEKIYLE